MTETLWPWLMVAATGALHGLNPANGWMLAAASGLRAGGRWQAWRAWGPVALGHVAAVALVVGAALRGRGLDRTLVLVLATTVLLLLLLRARRHARRGMCHPGHPALVAVAAFLLASVQGAGLMWVPALMPACTGTAGAAGFAPLQATALALGTLLVHLAAMLAAGALAAGGVGCLVRAYAARGGACIGTAPRWRSVSARASSR